MSDTVKIRTNNVPRDVIDACELTPAERTEFDYLNWPAIDAGRDSASFFRYRGQVYDLGEFMRADVGHGSPFARWDGYTNDSFFSGTLVRFVENGERVIVASFYA